MTIPEPLSASVPTGSTFRIPDMGPHMEIGQKVNLIYGGKLVGIGTVIDIDSEGHIEMAVHWSESEEG